jgi:hypothetical protein
VERGWKLKSTLRVDAGPARRRIEQLRGQGLSMGEIARRYGVSSSTVHAVATGRVTTITSDVATKITRPHR